MSSVATPTSDATQTTTVTAAAAPIQTVEQKLAKALELKEEGNKAFTDGDTKKALAKYTKVC
jgi:hypothetical protein